MYHEYGVSETKSRIEPNGHEREPNKFNTLSFVFAILAFRASSFVALGSSSAMYDVSFSPSSTNFLCCVSS